MDLYERLRLFKLLSTQSSKYGVIMPIVLAVLYFVGAAEIEYGYYTFLRIASLIFISILIIAYLSWSETPLCYTTVTFGLLQILFNPIVPISFEKETWVIFDIIAGFLMLSCSATTFYSFTSLPDNIKKYKETKL